MPVARIVAGYGRSGTTWVQDVLAESNCLRPVFEPLHPLHIEGAAPHASHFVPEDEENPDLYRLLRTYLEDDYWSLWADYRLIANHFYPRAERFASWQNFRKWISVYSNGLKNFRRYRVQRRRPERIIKFVRANMMLGWLSQTFGARVVFLMRHPAAVVASQMRAIRTWDPFRQIEIYRRDSRLLEALDQRVSILMARERDRVSALTLCWCIENSIAIRQAADRNLPVIHYENLVAHGDREWRRVLHALDLSQMPDVNLVSRPSQQAWGEKAVDSKLIRKYALWMDELDDQAKSNIQAILDATGMGIYSVDEAFPVAAAEELGG